MLQRICFASLPAVLLAACVCWSGCGKKEAASPPAASSQPVAAPVGPRLQVEPAGEVQFGRLLSSETRRFQYTIKNTTSYPLRIRTVRPGCYCTTLVQAPRGTIPPGGNAVLEFELSGWKLFKGDFRRTIHVSFENHPELDVALTFAGTLDPAISVIPGFEANLRRLAQADVPWERKFVLTGTFAPARKLVLGPPEHAGFLKVAIAEKDAAYEVTVSPAQPLPVGELSERIRIPIIEPSGYPPISLGIRGVIGPRLRVNPPMLVLPEVKAITGLTPQRVKIRAAFDAGSGYAVDAGTLRVTVPEEAKLIRVVQAGKDAEIEVDILPEMRLGRKVRSIEIAAGSAKVSLRCFVRKPEMQTPDAGEEPAEEE